MSGSLGLENASQQRNTILNSILSALRSGIAVVSVPSVYTVASLPGAGAPGQFAWASNGRKPGEGVGSGTGVPVFFNPGTNSWFSYLSGLAVTS